MSVFTINFAITNHRLPVKQMIDQWDKVVIDPANNSEYILLVIADQEASTKAVELTKILDPWSMPVVYYPVASIGNFPSLIQSFIKDQFQKHRPFVMDWGKQISQSVGYEANTVTYVFADKNFNIIHKLDGEIQFDDIIAFKNDISTILEPLVLNHP